MGGQAFANTPTASGKPPHVPRMSPEVYQRLSAEYTTKLETVFDRVVVPRDAPGKLDYGDIDFLAGGIKAHIVPPWKLWAHIKGGSHSYAIVHPETPEAYVQLDVELSPGDGTPEGLELFDWTAFMKGDGDLLQIIGITHRSLGLACNDKGLHFRVKDIFQDDKKKALLFLTRDPDRAMDFYGLDTVKYHQGFANETEMFDWVTSGRFFSASTFAERTEKSNDRSRQMKRPAYARFVEEYMPAFLDDTRPNEWTDEEVLQEALMAFDKKAEYTAMMEAHENKKAEEQLWHEIRTVLPVEGNPLKTAVRGLRRWVMFEKGEPRISADSIPDEHHTPWVTWIAPGSTEALLDWIKENWEQAKTLEKAHATASKVTASKR
ncbi:hypothetical protein FB567DRAFT_562814 [Paraphoma chrysanthemicola]|uniref:Uncharacterized protein n=1 Tax=Paraphoma chrysanthemicola TaxID=798071 RepID=A0A8K0R0E5_9PLEO|nr:hypothetical protein FB567DRAFT_562814 [Paraphoma chrysanthemicola]